MRGYKGRNLNASMKSADPVILKDEIPDKLDWRTEGVVGDVKD